MNKELHLVLHTLKSPQNVGMIVRSGVAFGCQRIIMIGKEPWRFKKGTQAFSRKLEKQANIEYFDNENEVFADLEGHNIISIALEISETRTSFLTNFIFPEKVALWLGNEGQGLPEKVIENCTYLITIPQYGSVGSLNVAVAASIGMYEYRRADSVHQKIIGTKFDEFRGT